MKYLLITLIVLAGLILVEGIEHATLSRGVTCELYFMQGQVNTAKSLDIIIEKLKEKKNSKGLAEFVEKLKEYQLYVADIYGDRECVKLEKGFVEILYFRVKNLLKGDKESQNGKE